MSASRRLAASALLVVLSACAGNPGPGGVVTGEVRVTEMGISAKAEATATVGEGGTTFSGPATITDCGQSMGASLSFRR